MLLRLAFVLAALADGAAGVSRPETAGGSSDRTCDPSKGECDADDGAGDDAGAPAEKEPPTKKDTRAIRRSQDEGCTLYLAPSSAAPESGLGVYSGRKIPKGESVHEFLVFADMESEDTYEDPMETAMFTDIFVSVFHTGRPFSSWMGYVWPPGPGAIHTGEGEGLASADGDIYLAEDGRHGHDDVGLMGPVPAFGTGIAALANTHRKYHNIERDLTLLRQESQNENSMGMVATPEGLEFAKLEAPYDPGAGAFAFTYGNDFLVTKKLRAGTELFLNYGKGYHKQHPADKESGPSGLGDITKPLAWLDEHGVCLVDGSITGGPTTIVQAGRGARAIRPLQAGAVVAVSPLLAVARDDLLLAGGGHQLLLNYAFGHPSSSLLLVPTAPIVNYVNHGARPNVALRWPAEGGQARKVFSTEGGEEENGWLKGNVGDVLGRSNQLAWEYVALRDIAPFEELLLDYGPEWDKEWGQFASMHPYQRSGYFRHEIGVPDGFYPSAWLDKE